MQTRLIHTGGAEIVTVADLDRDGWDDIIFTDWDGGKVHWARNNRDGTFTVSLIAEGLTHARDVSVRNVLNKAYDDILVSATGLGHFLFVNIADTWERFTIDASYGAAGITAGRLDGDALPDVVTCTQGVGGLPGTVTIWKNLDSGVFERVLDVPAQDPAGVVIAEFDGNDTADVVFSDSDGVVLLKNLGGLGFAAPERLLSKVGACGGMALVDTNRNGKPDVVVANQVSGPLLINNSTGAVTTIDPTLAGNYYVCGGPFTYPANGRVDIAAVSGSPTSKAMLYRQQADGSWLPETVATGYLTGRGCAFGDLLHNGRLQLVTSSYGLGTVEYWTE